MKVFNKIILLVLPFLMNSQVFAAALAQKKIPTLKNEEIQSIVDRVHKLRVNSPEKLKEAEDIYAILATNIDDLERIISMTSFDYEKAKEGAAVFGGAYVKAKTPEQEAVVKKKIEEISAKYPDVAHQSEYDARRGYGVNLITLRLKYLKEAMDELKDRVIRHYSKQLKICQKTLEKLTSTTKAPLPSSSSSLVIGVKGSIPEQIENIQQEVSQLSKTATQLEKNNIIAVITQLEQRIQNDLTIKPDNKDAYLAELRQLRKKING